MHWYLVHMIYYALISCVDDIICIDIICTCYVMHWYQVHLMHLTWFEGSCAHDDMQYPMHYHVLMLIQADWFSNIPICEYLFCVHKSQHFPPNFNKLHNVLHTAQPFFLHSAYPLGLESLGRYPLGLRSG